MIDTPTALARRLALHESDATRGAAVEITIADTAVRAYESESIAAAALASGARVLSRSLKYHRPRTFFCLEGHCSGCLVRLGGVPNLRACQTPCAQGVAAHGQNAFPSAELDLLGAVDFVFSRGLDHHTLMTGSSVLNRLANKVVRQLSGLGKLPDHAAEVLPDVLDRSVDVCVIGGGPAGLAAATTCARAGKQTLLVDDQLRPGGSLRADPQFLGTPFAEARWTDAIAAGVDVLARSTAIGFFPEDDGGVLAVASPVQLHRVHARAWVWATGGYVVNLPFPDNDRPGVIAARAVGRLLVDHGILAGDKVCLVEVPQLAHEAAALEAALGDAGAEVTRVSLADALGARGRGWVTGMDTTRGRVDCDLVAVAAIPSPASEGPRQQRCRVVLDPDAGGFRVVVDESGRTSVAGVWACGDVTGYMGTDAPRPRMARASVRTSRRRWSQNGEGRIHSAPRGRISRGPKDRALPLRGRHARRRRALRVARLPRYRGGQALHRLRHRPVSGQGVPRADGDAARAAHRQAAGGDSAVHVAAADRADADQAARERAGCASLRGRSVTPGSTDDDDEPDDSRADHSGEVRLPATLESTGPVPERAEVVIVGGGVMGLAIAYYLARHGLDDVVVIERGYLAEGASGRNGGGVRQQWSTEINIRLMQESVELCRRFAVELGVNVWFRQGGYFFLARSP